MTKKIIRALYALAVAAAAFLFIVYTPATAQSASNALQMCIETLIPSLFPFLVISALIVDTGIAKYAGQTMEPLMRPLFNVPGCSTSAFLLGLLSGYPVGTITTVSLYRKRLCTKEEAERMLAFCSNTGPGFIIGMVGAGLYRSTKAGVVLYIIHVLSAIITGFIVRFIKFNVKAPKREDAAANSPNKSGVVACIKSAAANMLYICAFVIFFSVIVGILNALKVLPYISSAIARAFPRFPGSQMVISKLLIGIIEMVSGITAKAPLSAMTVAATSAIIAWAGIAIHMQAAAALQGSGLSLKPYITGKAIQAAVAGLLTYPVALRLFDSIPVFWSTESAGSFTPALLIPWQIYVMLGLGVFAVWLLLTIASRKTR